MLFTLLALFLNAPVARALTPAEVERAYNGCVAFLKMTPDQQKEVASRTPYTYEQTLWGCQTMARNGLARSQELEREYQDSLRRPAPPTPANPPRTLMPGTCYYLHGCNGRTVHAENGPGSCPAGFDSFKYDSGTYGCFNL